MDDLGNFPEDFISQVEGLQQYLEGAAIRCMGKISSRQVEGYGIKKSRRGLVFLQELKPGLGINETCE